MIKKLKNLFAKEYRLITISPYMTIYQEEVPENIKEVCKAISNKLTEYEDKMVIYANNQNNNMKKVQLISATYNPNNSDMTVTAYGTKPIFWKGKLQGFLSIGNLLEQNK